MKSLVITAAAALAISAGLATAALAGGDAYATAKDYHGIPVPAPVPIPEYEAQYYFRADVGVGFGTSPDLSESGLTFGAYNGSYGGPGTTGPGGGPTPFGTSGAAPVGAAAAFAFTDDFDFLATAGLGVGRYIGGNLRGDLTIEGRSEKSAALRGTYSYNAHDYTVFAAGPPIVYSYDPIVDGVGTPNLQVDGTVSDETSLRQAVFLANLYYDLNRWGRLTPYLGVGVGFAYNELQRSVSMSESTCDPTGIPGSCPGAFPVTTSGSAKDYSVSLAAAFMAGFTYGITDGLKLDMNYRYFYVDGSDVTVAVNGQSSTVSIGAQTEHQLRAGLRWDIN